MSVTIKGSGQVPVQIQTTTLTSQFSTTSATFTNVTGLSISITPTNASNKILIMVSMFLGTSSNSLASWALTRNGSLIDIGTGGSTLNTTGTFYTESGGSAVTASVAPGTIYLDSPATTSAVTYQIQLAASGGTAYVNRRGYGSDFTGPSTIVVMEIAYA